ncbi:MAG: GNAT family N-acetyltransferase [Candidatus Nomurabacteria bacterium]
MKNYEIIEIKDSNILEIQEIANETSQDNYNFVQRTIDEWKNNTNKFSKIGEKLWGIIIDNKIIGIGGLNKDPFIEDEKVGKVRHIYISKQYRGFGLSKILLNLIIEKAKENFTTLRLSTNNPIASSVYESLGFKKVEGIKVTHQKDL